MIDYALNFYDNYTFISYILLLIAVVIEGPITILTLSLFASRLWFSFILIYFLAFLWEFLWDLLNYSIWRFFKKNIFKDKKFIIFENIEKKIENHPLFDKIVVIKYTPFVVAVWLMYLWFQKTNIKEFMKNISLLALIDSFAITFIWFHLWKFLIDKSDFKYIMFWVMLSFLIIFFLFRTITSYFVKRIINEKN